MMKGKTRSKSFKAQRAGVAFIGKVCLRNIKHIAELVILVFMSRSQMILVASYRTENGRRMFKASPYFPVDSSLVLEPLSSTTKSPRRTVRICADVWLKVMEYVSSINRLDETPLWICLLVLTSNHALNHALVGKGSCNKDKQNHFLSRLS